MFFKSSNSCQPKVFHPIKVMFSKLFGLFLPILFDFITFYSNVEVRVAEFDVLLILYLSSRVY